MNRKILLTLLSFIIFTSTVYAIGFQIFDMRNKIFEESKEIKSFLPKSRDGILLTAMFDSCIIATTQLDAYFSMLGVFESINKKDLTDVPVYFVTGWLSEIKKTNDLNLKILSSVGQPLDSNTRVHIKKLQALFNELNIRIMLELDKFSTIRESLKIRKR